ncbi:MAG: DEAD/DEAH box helicase [DPANN group archaeon]|nr:DEAD/DEAH box helicase [DPANN group archaeon]
MKFQDLGLDPQLVKAVEEIGYEEPTDIQATTIPLIRAGRDVFGQSSTGSGKTAAFGLPILERIQHKGRIQVLVLVPTRELCEQVAQEFVKFSKYKSVKILAVYGGVGIGQQIKNLKDTDVVIGTPGRILDHINRRTLDLQNIKFLVLDEADKMFDMGFVRDIRKIIQYVPKARQTLLFSATISSDIIHLAKNYMVNPEKVKAEEYVQTGKLKQIYHNVTVGDKFSLLVHLLAQEKPTVAVVFCATRKRVNSVEKNLKKYTSVLAIHGGLTQSKRNSIMDLVKSGEVNVLVATDVAARGIDIKTVTHVFNYDVPKTSKDYVHRIGRTARAGETGKAITLLCPEDHENFRHVLADSDIDVAEQQDFQRLQFEVIRTDRQRFNHRRFSNNRGSARHSNNRRWR